MKKAIIFSLLALFLFSTSCGDKKATPVADNKMGMLEKQRDSLLLLNKQVNIELERLMDALNEIDANFQAIKAAENYVEIQTGGDGRLTQTTMERIRGDMQFITELLAKNRAHIADLEKKAKNYAGQLGQSKGLQATIVRLQTDLSAKDAEIAALKAELAKKDRLIEDLTFDNMDLEAKIQALKEKDTKQRAMIARQQIEIRKVYYCFGTAKELKTQRIALKGQLGTNFNSNYFIEADKIALKTIQLFAKKAKLVSKHPIGSYQFVKKANKELDLQITNPTKFWSLTKYLVVEVKP
ncbi:hypothetical protein SAMD00024442_8_64 [Candidatus Symbiothrix dinenymphae]|nr:hypothetical protein SAMD00024442_8_64 [Candidatus Symbiothrix dinenymphae]